MNCEPARSAPDADLLRAGAAQVAAELVRLDARHAAAERWHFRASVIVVLALLLGGLASWYAAVILRSLPTAAWIGGPVAAVAAGAFFAAFAASRFARRRRAELARILGALAPAPPPAMPLGPGERIGRWLVLESTPERLHVTRRSARWIVVLQRLAIFVVLIGLAAVCSWMLIYHGAFSGPSRLQLSMKPTVGLAILTPIWLVCAGGSLLPVTFQWTISRADGMLTVEQVRLIFLRELTEIATSEIREFASDDKAFGAVTHGGARLTLFEHPVRAPYQEKGAPPDPVHITMRQWRSVRFEAAVRLALTGTDDSRPGDAVTRTNATAA